MSIEIDIAKESSVQQVLDNFPIDSGTNFKNMTPVTADATHGTSTLTNVVNVSGSGILVSIASLAPGYEGYIQIIIDGVTMVSGMPVLAGSSMTNLIFMFKFNTSLIVQHRNERQATIRTIVNYLLG